MDSLTYFVVFLANLLLALLARGTTQAPSCNTWSAWSTTSSCQWINPCLCVLTNNRTCQNGSYTFDDRVGCSEETSQNHRRHSKRSLCINQACPRKSGWGEWEPWTTWDRRQCPLTRIRTRPCIEGGQSPGTPMGRCLPKLEGYQREVSTPEQCYQDNDEDEHQKNREIEFATDYFINAGIGTLVVLFLIGGPSIFVRCLCVRRRNRRLRETEQQLSLDNNPTTTVIEPLINILGREIDLRYMSPPSTVDGDQGGGQPPPIMGSHSSLSRLYQLDDSTVPTAPATPPVLHLQQNDEPPPSYNSVVENPNMFS